jgi:hypothetical protein
VRPNFLFTLIGVLILAASYATPAGAAPWEFHGGLYTSYEYTDNYLGTADNEESESIFKVGPSAQVIYTEGTAKLDLNGHYARSIHQEYTDDDSNDIILNSLYTVTSPVSSFLLGYTYTEALRNSVLSSISGNSRTQAGRMNYTRGLTSTTRGGLSYTYYQEDNDGEEEDIVSHGVTVSVDQEITQLISLHLTNGYDTHRYNSESDTPDSWSVRSTASLERTMTQTTSLSVDGEYQHVGQEEDTVPDADIVTSLLTMRHAFSPALRIILSAGYTWLTMEDMDREQTYALRGELRHETPFNMLSLRASREYVAEFTTDRYGTYEARSVYFTWERSLLKDLKLMSNITYEERKPVSGNTLSPVQEKEQDISGLVSLAWNPLRYLFITPGYEHYERIRENEDTETENRYKVVVEVRY